MKRITACLVLAACALSCSASKPAGPIAEAPLVEEVEIDIEGSREVLEQFLEARWSFDREAAAEHVTTEDAGHQWPGAIDQWVQLMDMLAKDRPWREWYAWNIVEVEPVEQGKARATVEVVYPTAAAIMSNLARTNLERVRVMTKVRDPMKMPMVMQKAATAFVPTRLIRRMDYEIVRDEAGEWKVWMDWKTLSSSKDKLDLSNFSGSEKVWAEASAQRLRQNAPDKAEHRELARGARKAEQAARERKYDDAIQQYDQLLMSADVPDLIAGRPAALTEARTAWEARKEEAKIAFDAGDPVRDGERFRYPVEVKNNGPRAVRRLHARVWFSTTKGSEPHAFSMGKLKADETKVGKAWLYSDKAATVDRVELVSVTFEGESEDPTRKRDHEYEWALQDYERGYVATYAATRVSTAVRALEDDLHQCDGWPEEPVDVRIEIAPTGTIESVSADGADELAGCVEEKSRSLQFPETEQPWGAVVQLFPRDYWEKLGARDPR